MNFSIFTELHSHHQNLILEHFQQPENKPHAHLQFLPICTPSRRATTNLLSVFNLSLLDILYK